MDETLKHTTESNNPEQHHAEVLPPVKARQGVISGRVLLVLVMSVLILAVIYTIIWLANARL
jgi:hypothetical protein